MAKVGCWVAAWLAAAAELVARGFQMEVFERGLVFGGKTRSWGVRHGTDSRRDLPGSMGFASFPASRTFPIR
jgi:uncharacterized protein with NAD-binding domain and iron-sulfur cluster